MKCRGLTTKDLASIIKTCGESGVTEIKFGDLFISFAKIKEKQEPSLNYPLNQVEKITPKTEIKEKDFVGIDEVIQKEEKLANMLLESPQEYEEALLRDDLVDVGEEADDKEAGWY